MRFCSSLQGETRVCGAPSALLRHWNVRQISLGRDVHSIEPLSLVETHCGKLPLWSPEKMRRAMPICLRLFVPLIFCAFSFALDKAGKSMLARIAMMAM